MPIHSPPLPARRPAPGLRATLMAAAVLCIAPLASAEPADLVLRNARVYTVDAGQPWARAVAVKGSTLVHVGADDADSLRTHIGPATRVVDLEGQMVLPGFIDAHIHPILSSFLTGGADLQHATRGEMLKALEQYARANPTGPVWGFGWRPDMFGPEGPHKRELDRIFPDRPVFMLNIDFHSMWFNSRALEVTDITRDTPDPVPGFSIFQRDAKGEPTGYALEPATYLPMVNTIVPITPDTLRNYLAQWLPKASAAGLTSVFDAGVPPIGDDPAKLLSLYTDLEATGKLPLRVIASYATRGPDEPPPLPALQRMRERVATELVQVRALKVLADGTEGGHTAVLLAPYADKPDTRGKPPFTQAQLNALVTDVDQVGFDAHVHCDGDGCVRMTLDAIETAMAANPPRDRRHTIAHLVTLDPADLPRFAKLGVIAQPGVNWATADPDTMVTLRERLGEHRHAHNLYRARSLVDSGARVSFGTDWAAAGYYSTYKPLDVIEIGMTRQLLGQPDAPILAPANERLTLAQMLKGYTLDAAYQLGLEGKTGSLTIGKRADLVVLGKNLFDVAPHAIHTVPVVATMMDGRLTHGTLAAP